MTPDSAQLRVDPELSTPFYVQLAEILRRRISQKEWPNGSRIPTETELCDTYHVSRITVRQALSRLANDGLITRARGRGTFVSFTNLTAAPRSVSSFSTELTELGMQPGSKVIALRTIKADAGDAQLLGCEIGTELFQINRVRTADGTPIGVQHTKLIAARFPGILEHIADDVSLYQLLHVRYGVIATGATETFRATGVRHDEAKLLNCRVGHPAFHVTRVTFDSTGVFERTSSILHGERYQIQIALSNTQTTKGTL